MKDVKLVRSLEKTLLRWQWRLDVLLGSLNGNEEEPKCGFCQNYQFTVGCEECPLFKKAVALGAHKKRKYAFPCLRIPEMTQDYIWYINSGKKESKKARAIAGVARFIEELKLWLNSLSE